MIARECTCDCIDAAGPSWPAFEALQAAAQSCSGERLIELAAQTHQVIDGDFLGRLPDEAEPSLIIQAFDSSYWEVYGDADCLQRLRARFRAVTPASAR